MFITEKESFLGFIEIPISWKIKIGSFAIFNYNLGSIYSELPFVEGKVQWRKLVCSKSGKENLSPRKEDWRLMLSSNSFYIKNWSWFL